MARGEVGMAEANLHFLEAAYAWERQDEAWLQGLVRAAAQAWGSTAWACGLIYDASDVERFRCERFETVDGLQPPDVFVRRLASLPPRFVARTYRSLRAGFTRSLDAHAPPMFEELDGSGSRDVFGLNGRDPRGDGCAILLGTDQSTLSEANTERFARLADHLASAYRCRRRLKTESALDTAEAILAPDGDVIDARGPARAAGARAALRETTRAIQSCRSGAGSEDPVPRWPPRVQTRWTLVEAYAQDGARYVVARENLAWPQALEVLTERECEVVSCAAAGKTNKELAYELGISPATARVLLARAAARLGVRTREDLLALPCVRSLVEASE